MSDKIQIDMKYKKSGSAEYFTFYVPMGYLWDHDMMTFPAHMKARMKMNDLALRDLFNVADNPITFCKEFVFLKHSKNPNNGELKFNRF